VRSNLSQGLIGLWPKLTRFAELQRGEATSPMRELYHWKLIFNFQFPVFNQFSMFNFQNIE